VRGTGLALAILGLSGAVALAHTVGVKQEEVFKNNRIDYNDEEPTASDSVIYLGTNYQVRIASKTFTPPPNWVFKRFPSSNTHVDIWDNPEGLDYQRLTDSSTAIKVRGTFLTAINAGEYPLRCEGNMQPIPRGGGGGGPAPTDFHWSAKVKPGILDLDIDSDNSHGIYGGPNLTDEEDAMEESAPGKYIPRNDGDEDGDLLESFADGFGLSGAEGGESSAGTQFVPLVLDATQAGEIDWSSARVKIDYSASAPAGVTAQQNAQQKTFQQPAAGMLRLWKSNAATRNSAPPPAGHYLAPGEYAASAIFAGQNPEATWYAEGIGEGTVAGLVTVQFKRDGTADWIEDKVYVTVVHGDLDVDSDNNNGTNPPDRDGYEDRIEMAQTLDGQPYYGKLLCVNDGDKDNDGIVDTSDWHITNSTVRFTPLAITLPAPLNSSMRLKLEYPSGVMRLWRKNASDARDERPFPDGDYLAPGELSGTDLAALGYDAARTKHFGIEGLAPALRQTIAISVDPDGNGPAQYVHTDKAQVTVLKVEMVNAWETDDVCNRVLNPKQTTSNRLFVATESNDQAQITVKATIQPAGAEDKVLCAVYDGSTHLVSTGFPATCEAELNFTPTGPAKNYAIRVGLDANGNGTLEVSEFYTTATNFNVTAFTSAHYNDQRSSLSDEMDVVKYIYPVGASLLIHFLNRTDQVYAFNTTNSIGINCFTQNNLTHNAGETFAPGGNGTLDEFVWYAGSAASEKIANSDEIKGAINSVLAAHRSEVTNFFAANPTATVYEVSWSQSNIATNFAETREWMLDEYDLHVAYGHATISSMTVSVVVKKDGSTIYTDNLIVTGVLTDLYDFNYEDGGRAGKAAVLQIGWDTDITGRDAGNIYFDKANFQETFDEWDFTY